MIWNICAYAELWVGEAFSTFTNGEIMRVTTVQFTGEVYSIEWNMGLTVHPERDKNSP